MRCTTKRSYEPGVRNGGVALEVQDVVDGGAKERAIVAHEQHGAIEVFQVRLEPLRRVQVEVVGGLVEQQDVGRAHELARQPEAAAFAAAERGDRSRPRRLRIEAESVEHGVDARGDLVAALALESLEVAPIAIERGLRGVGA